jgi:hypothetical protein
MKIKILVITFFLSNSILMNCQEFKRDLRDASSILIVKINQKDSLINKWFDFKFDLIKSIKGSLSQNELKVGYCRPFYSYVNKDRSYYLVKTNDQDSTLLYRFYDYNNYGFVYRYISDSIYRNSVGQDSNSLLNVNESDYLASRFNSDTFDFKGKRICFFFDTKVLTKQDYFRQLGAEFSFDQLLVFDNKDKEQVDFDAAIISWHKFNVKSEKDKYIKRIKKYTAHNTVYNP